MTRFFNIVKLLLVLLSEVLCCAIGRTQFINVTGDQIGISIVNENTIYGNGVSFYDFNRDGWDDMTIADGAQNIHFFLNDSGNFSEISLGITNTGAYQVIMVLWADYDNDGDEDLLVTRSNGPIQLWQNQGDLTFIDVAVEAGLEVGNYFYWGAAFADYDHDGFLDLFISKYYHPTFNPGYEFRSILYHNNGDGTFTDVNLSSGFDLPPRPCFQPVFLDYNHDGWEDFFLVIDRIAFSNELYRNNGDGTFTNVTAASGVGQSICSMTGTADDFDNDLDEDIYVTNGPNGNLLLVNQDGSFFVNQAADMGVVLNQVTWGSLWIDYDNNSWLDLFVSVTSPVLAPIGNQFFVNNQGTSFTNATSLVGLADDDTETYMVATGDFNNDGYPDFVTNNKVPDESNLWQNVGGGNHYIGITLEGVIANKNGIGSSIHCYAGGQHYYRQTKCGENFTAQNSGKEIFGLGAVDFVDSLVVYWNSGTIDRYYQLESDHYYNFREGTSHANSFQILSNGGGFCPQGNVTLDGGNYLSYLWNTGDTARYVDVSDTGYYYVVVNDVFGNQITSDSIYIIEYPLPQPSITANNPSCKGLSNGSVVISSFGQELYTSWSDGFEGNFRDNLEAGNYYLTVFNSFGCQDDFELSLTEPDSLHLFAQIQGPTCFGHTNGEILPFALGGTPPYAFEPTIENLVDLGQGAYQVVVNDALGCSEVAEYELTQPSIMQIEMIVEDVHCFGENTGHLEVNVSGGTGSYLIVTPIDPENLAAGEYNVLVTDSLGCTVDTTFNVSQPDLLSCNVIVTPQYNNGEFGTASLNISGGISPYEIDWSEGNDATTMQSNLSAGNYEVSVVDAFGCGCSAEFMVDLIETVESINEQPFVIFPQPARNLLYIKNESGLAFNCKIIDTKGQLVHEEFNHFSNLVIDVRNYPQGLYFINFYGMGMVFSTRCLIIH
jgi:hypothetical protein